MTTTTAIASIRDYLPRHVRQTLDDVGTTDRDVWTDIVDVRDGLATAVLERVLDEADDTATAWRYYVDCLEVYVALGRPILRPIDRSDAYDLDPTDVVDVDGRPVLTPPPWCEVQSVGQIGEIARHGAGACAAQCCFYHDASVTMGKHGDDVLQYLYDAGVEPIMLDPSSSWTGFASHVLTIAVETWCSQADATLDETDLYIVESKVTP